MSFIRLDVVICGVQISAIQALDVISSLDFRQLPKNVLRRIVRAVVLHTLQTIVLIGSVRAFSMVICLNFCAKSVPVDHDDVARAYHRLSYSNTTCRFLIAVLSSYGDSCRTFRNTGHLAFFVNCCNAFIAAAPSDVLVGSVLRSDRSGEMCLLARFDNCGLLVQFHIGNRDEFDRNCAACSVAAVCCGRCDRGRSRGNSGDLAIGVHLCNC